MTNGGGAMDDSMPLEAMDELVSSGGLAEASPDEAFSLIAHSVSRPSLGGRPVSLADEGVDSDVLEQFLVDRYMDAAAERAAVEADGYAQSLRLESDEIAASALCGAAGLPRQAYADACAQRDEGDPSFMLSLYSRFLDSL